MSQLLLDNTGKIVRGAPIDKLNELQTKAFAAVTIGYTADTIMLLDNQDIQKDILCSIHRLGPRKGTNACCVVILRIHCIDNTTDEYYLVEQNQTLTTSVEDLIEQFRKQMHMATAVNTNMKLQGLYSKKGALKKQP